MRWCLLVLLLLGTGDALAQRRRVRQPCASHGMSCEPGPCCKGTTCDSLGVCRKPEKEWSEGRKDPGPDDPPKKKTDEKSKR